MKNLSLLFVLTLSLFLWSCGDTNTKTDKTKDKNADTQIENKKKEKSIEQRKEEGKVIRSELEKYDLQIPENLVYKESLINAMAFKKSTFIAENVGEKERNELDDWYAKQIDDLVKQKWEKNWLQKNDTISGILFNSYSFKRPQGGQSSLSDMLTITTAYNPRGTYSVYFKPYVLGKAKEMKVSKEEMKPKDKLNREEMEIQKRKADVPNKKKE